MTNTGKLSVTFKPVAFYPIEDGDNETAKFYESNGVQVRTINLNGVNHRYALIEVSTQDEADRLNSEFNRISRKAARDKQKQLNNETSYDKLVDEGYDSAVDGNDPAEIVVDIIVIEALLKELDTLSEENTRICQMLSLKMSERDIAAELGIAQTTLHDRKMKLLKELKVRLS
jgi:DNA-directed RNA polymerase specialized sigma subunit